MKPATEADCSESFMQCRQAQLGEMSRNGLRYAVPGTEAFALALGILLDGQLSFKEASFS